MLASTPGGRFTGIRAASGLIAVVLPVLACSKGPAPADDPVPDWEPTGYVWRGGRENRRSLGPCVSEPWRETEGTDHVVTMQRLEDLRSRIGDRLGQRYTIDRRGSLLRWRAVGLCRRADGTPLTNLLLSILDKVDVHRDRRGDSTGRLTEV